VGKHTFVLGADRQTDWILTRPVGGALRRSEPAPGNRNA
jgi:hypothetical protein